MVPEPPHLHAKVDELSRPETPRAFPSQASSLQPMIPQASSDLSQDAPPSPPTHAPASDEPQPTQFLLPLPTPSSNASRASFAFPDVLEGNPLPPEIASADISIAPDGSFVETSSGPAARELKRRYDQHLGVGMSVRSPYAITAFVNQHGKQMYRVGRRELSAPAASAPDVEQQILQPKPSAESSPSHSPRSKRRSRMSMAFLPPAVFHRNGSTAVFGRPQTAHTNSIGPRKLRKTRSIPDMISSAANEGPSIHSHQHHAATITGRAHSQSVTAADISPFTTVDVPYPPPRAADMFAGVMDWLASPTGSSTHSLSFPGERRSITNFHEQAESSTILSYPFGEGVSFDSPSRKPAFEHLPTPRLLREMHSFESGLTARQIEPLVPKDSPVYEDDGGDRPPSALRLRAASSMIKVSDRPPPPDPAFSPSPETALLSRYSTDVFDVLQTYRGLPLLEKLSPESEETTVIKMSLSADGTAAPRDDPRFVIWGEIQPDRDRDDHSNSHDSLTDLSASVPASSMSRKRSTKSAKAKAPEPSSVLLSTVGNAQKVLVAATIERWIAQLTSDLNYDELLDFFLTYRTYISAVDLCHLLICRFHWALQQPSSAHDETVRRIVRVRTFVAIRYWLLTFFTVDFLPNRELRLLVANWLNTLMRDPILEKHSDGLGIVRRLIKVAKECKQAHSRSASKPKPRTPVRPKRERKHVLGERFAEATRKPGVEEEDSDVDLDFLPDEAGLSDITSGFPSDPANAHLNAVHFGAGFSPTRPSSMPLASMSMLQRTDHVPGTSMGSDVPFPPTSTALPIHHSALSRAFVKTIGRLGRWRRVLNSRSGGRASLDLLTVNGGVEQYLRLIESQPHIIPAPVPPPIISPSYIDQSSPVTISPQINGAPEPPQVPDLSALALPEPAVYIKAQSHEPLHPGNTTKNGPADSCAVCSGPVEPQERAVSIRSSSTDSFGEPLTTAGGPAPMFPPLDRPQWQFDVVSIDDLDLSDTSSDDHGEDEPSAPPGLRRPVRRLPLRRDFEFIRRSESVSSMGITSHDSMTSPSNSAVSSTSVAGLGGNIQQWQMNALVDSLSDDEETGDVEAALRRLEGQINPKKKQEKASKVDGWVRTIQERMAAGDYGDDQPRFPDDEEDEDREHASGSSHEDHNGSVDHNGIAVSTPSASDPGHSQAEGRTLESVNTPIPTQTSHIIPSSGIASPPRSEAKPAPEDAVPIEILQSRMSTGLPPPTPPKASLSSNFGNAEAPRAHRSFILNHRAELLARHFAMIDRELFMGVKFEELVLDDWMACEEIDVLDWAQFLKDRARWKAESRWSEKTSALAAVRARFNLMANFVVSEVVLTLPGERAIVVAKFIRIAWKSYGLSNFNTMIAIIAGLRSDWVTKAMRRFWGRVGMWEMRMFNDLKLYTTSADDFKYMRQAVEAIADAKPLDAGSHAPSVISGGGTDNHSGKNKVASERPAISSACVPFIGIYLSQLHRYSRLPDLIDPTAPNEAVGIDPITANFDTPAHPEVFSALAPLPPSMHLEPLINVHKQRRIAGVIKSLVAGQHLASRVQFEVDKKLLQRCLRLRGLDAATLQRALSMYPD